MKARTLVSILIYVLGVLIVVGSCATKQKAISEEEFYQYWVGTWINTDLHRNDWTPQKIINHPNGSQDRYTAPDMPKGCTHQYTLNDWWKDSKGNIWYIATSECRITPDTPIQEYGKISISNNTYELIYTLSNETIQEWEPDNPLYFHLIYYRSD